MCYFFMQLGQTNIFFLPDEQWLVVRTYELETVIQETPKELWARYLPMGLR